MAAPALLASDRYRESMDKQAETGELGTADENAML
jgi:hypothetical protein